jgi:hypothetical protein
MTTRAGFGPANAPSRAATLATRGRAQRARALIPGAGARPRGAVLKNYGIANDFEHAQDGVTLQRDEPHLHVLITPATPRGLTRQAPCDAAMRRRDCLRRRGVASAGGLCRSRSRSKALRSKDKGSCSSADEIGVPRGSGGELCRPPADRGGVPGFVVLFAKPRSGHGPNTVGPAWLLLSLPAPPRVSLAPPSSEVELPEEVLA